MKWLPIKHLLLVILVAITATVLVASCFVFIQPASSNRALTEPNIPASPLFDMITAAKATSHLGSASNANRANTTNSDSSAANSSNPATTISSSSSLQIYSDSACQTPLSGISWGSLSPGGTVSKQIYIKNTAQTGTLTLSAGANNWSPTSASQYLKLTCDKQGTKLAPGQSTDATITLSVAANIVDISTFGFDVAIIGQA